MLAAGVGRRLEGSTYQGPKCLLPIGGQHLLGRTLDALVDVDAGEATIVVGHCAEQVRTAAGDNWHGMTVRYVYNPDFRAGSILSLWRAREELQGDVLVMDADVLFPPILLRRLVQSLHRSCVLLDSRVVGSGEEMILCAAQGRVWDIVRRRAGQPLQPPPGVGAYDVIGESVGFMKVAAADTAVLREAVEREVGRGIRNTDHETIYPDFFARCQVGYERVDDLPWTEIDFPEDLSRARIEILPLIEGSGEVGGSR